MQFELKVPAVGESVTEIQVGQWVKQIGEKVDLDATVVILETDKTTVELPAPAAGTITKVLKKQGEKAKVGDVLGYLEGVAPAKPAAAAMPAPATPAATPLVQAPPPSGAANDVKKEGKDFRRVRLTRIEVKPRVMPAARRILSENDLNADDITGTGPGERITKEDALNAAASAPTEAVPPPARAAAAPAPAAPLASQVPIPAATAPVAAATVSTVTAGGARQEEVIAMSPLRRKVAARLVEAQHTAALLTTFNEIDMSAVMALRKDHQEAFQKQHKVKLGFMSFFVKAAIDALKHIPTINAEIRGSDIVYHNNFDIGIAIGGGKGLVVPVLRNAERLSFAEIEIAIGEYAKRAQDNKLKVEELLGGTFTISNGGVYGSMLSTPIVNPPQSGILGLHAIQDRPVARDGQVVIRPMMYIALSYDHRLVDGREAVTFLKRIKEVIENPARMLLEV
ncbi:MAG TPA: 2-oxoglutarate dehydrogenase complex dihydrolipoyllysine-residue succinyltransferase [Planctomycetota bacterium]|nr:2-oxoglutarate dehydrogenase complex dihydrolipoyllysine-residue succinyltransferase [Planctomycetota bacterium]